MVIARPRGTETIMKIRKIMSRSTHAVSAGTTIAQTAEQMRRFDIGALPVIESDKVVGIVTDRDIVIRAVAAGLPSGTAVSEVMSQPVLSCGPEDNLDAIMATMSEQQVRRMPVCSERGHLVGMLSIGDAARYDPDKQEVAETISEISRPFGRHCQTHAAA
jgi:CBS domain-containing protein